MLTVNEPVEGADNLLHGGGDVRAVSKDDVHIVEAEALERGVGTLDDVLARQTTGVVDLLAVGAKEDLGRDDNVAAVPAKLPDDTAHLKLRLASGVALGVLRYRVSGRNRQNILRRMERARWRSVEVVVEATMCVAVEH